MDEKSNEKFLPSFQGHTVTTPNDVQQLIIKDSTVFIGHDRPRRSISSCFRYLNILILTLTIGMVMFTFLPVLYQLTKLLSISGTAGSGYHLSLNRDILDPMVQTVKNTARMVASLPNVFNQNDLSSKSSKLDATILYSFDNPSNYLYDCFNFNTVYIARAEQTILSFFIQNDLEYTYLDDVSVNNSYGSPLLVNGDFENGTYGWLGLNYREYCYSSSYMYSHSYCASNKYLLSHTMSQKFNTTPGSVLYISFKLRWSGSGSGVSTRVIIYP